MLYIAGIEPESVVDGEGWRYAVFTQGCLHHCKGCHNPQTWEMKKGTKVSVSELVDRIVKAFNENILMDGVTISGGDPLYQPDEIYKLCELLKEHDINIWVYTGFTFEQVLSNDKLRNILGYIDVLVDGPFIEKLRSLELQYKGSSNQRIIDVQASLKSNDIILYDLEGEE